MTFVFCLFCEHEEWEIVWLELKKDDSEKTNGTKNCGKDHEEKDKNKRVKNMINKLFEMCCTQFGIVKSKGKT